MKRYIIVLVAMVCLLPLAAQGQKGKTKSQNRANGIPVRAYMGDEKKRPSIFQLLKPGVTALY